jgi:hypothetical protein
MRYSGDYSSNNVMRFLAFDTMQSSVCPFLFAAYPTAIWAVGVVIKKRLIINGVSQFECCFEK